MTPEIIKCLVKAYNGSHKDKAIFFELIRFFTGLKKQAFKQGYLKDFVDNADWNIKQNHEKQTTTKEL